MACTIVIVDDSKPARMAAAEALNALQPDWTGTGASNADAALALPQQSSVDVALLDFDMPGRDGIAPAADLPELNPAMSIALISPDHQGKIVSRAREIGVTSLSKPLKEQALGAFPNETIHRLEAAA